MKKGEVSGCYMVFVLVYLQGSTIAIFASEWVESLHCYLIR